MAWTIEQIARTFIAYMVEHGHVEIEGRSVRSPTDDVLFTTAGMHPLTPYLKGEPHPAGRRLTDVQRCVRTTDVDEVGDNTHLTVFEMLGNWSLGDYFKETSIPQSFELLTGPFGIDPHSIYVTIFAGAEGLPFDAEAKAIWEQTFADAGVDPSKGRINPLVDNWWSNGPVGLCGPDTEIFVYVGDEAVPTFADVPEFVEIWNNVFMSFDRSATGELSALAQRNVDTGMGLERLALFLDRHHAVWETDELHELTVLVGDTLGVSPDGLGPDQTTSLRIVTDHLRAALAIAAAGIAPAASRQGYVLRKLIRRAVRHGELLKGTDQGLAPALIEATDRVSTVMGRRWPDVGPGEGGDLARGTLEKEASRFAKVLRNGVDDLQSLADSATTFDGDLAFRFADTLGYPVELSAEEARRIGMTIDPGWEERYDALREEQRARSRR